MNKGAGTFVNTRTRLQRMKDAKFFYGWVSDFDERDVRIRLTSSASCEPGDVFMVEIYGQETVASFQAILSMSFENQIYLAVQGSVMYRRTSENARICVAGMFGTMTTESGEIAIRVADVSRGGLAAVLPKSLPRGEKVRLKLCTPAGEITGEGDIRYCRPDPSGSGSFRAGVRLAEFGRLEKARWLRVFEQEAA